MRTIANKTVTASGHKETRVDKDVTDCDAGTPNMKLQTLSKSNWEKVINWPIQ